MSDEDHGLSVQELQRVIARKSQAMQILAERVSLLTLENVELITIIDELQNDLAVAQQTLVDLKTSGDLLAQLGSDHGDLHATGAARDAWR